MKSWLDDYGPSCTRCGAAMPLRPISCDTTTAIDRHHLPCRSWCRTLTADRRWTARYAPTPTRTAPVSSATRLQL
jgi:hypothetical protein